MIFLSFWNLNKRKISWEVLGMPSHMEILFDPEIIAVSLQNLSQVNSIHWELLMSSIHPIFLFHLPCIPICRDIWYYLVFELFEDLQG